MKQVMVGFLVATMGIGMAGCWSPKKDTPQVYTVIFDSQGADVEAVPTNKTVTTPATTLDALPTPPTKTGYNFAGWYTEPSGGGTAFTVSTAVTADITVYANWSTYPVYTVTYDSDGGTAIGEQFVTYPATTVETLPAPPTKIGYDFGGWYTATGGGGTAFTAGTTVTANITVSAKWNSYAYVVIFDSQGGSGSVASKTVASPATTIDALPAPPTRTGYNFAGWYTAPSGGGTAFTVSTTVTASITVYANWSTYAVYIVTYDSDGGTVVGEQYVTLPATTVGTLPAPPTRAGYTFAGWYTEPSGGGTAFTPSTTVTASITVYAKWTACTYTIIFDGRGATTEADPTIKTVTSPATTVDALPAPPSKNGYTFAGWYIAPNGGGTAFTASTVVTASITVYAKWSNCSVYTVTYDSDGGTAAGEQYVTCPATTVVTLPLPPTKNGYIFAGWYTEPSGGGTAFTASTTVTASVTVYANWTACTYTVIFDGRGATTEAVPTIKTVISPATTIDALPTPPIRNGYTFAGWYIAPSGGGTAFTASTIVTASITVYANWTACTYTVTFDSQGATIEANPTSKTVTAPATTVGTLPTPPSKTDYTFAGWYTETSGGGTSFTASTNVTADITVYAYWSTNPVYTVTYDSDGGTVVGEQYVTLPATTVGTLPAPPTKAGYNFAGWYTEPSGGGTAFTVSTTVTANITVYANWTACTYTVIFDGQGATVAADPTIKTVTSPAATIGALPAPPSKNGYSFAGWYTAPSGGGTAFIASTAVTANITVYANWTAGSYIVTFDSQGGTSVASKTVTSPATTIDALPTPPSKTGYTFGGWYTASDGSGAAFTASTTVAANITVYANWAVTGLSFTLINCSTEYEVKKGTAVISGNLTIPRYWLGLPVTAIGSYAFANSYNITSVTIPSGVTSIGAYAFQSCSGLTSIEIPSSVTSLGDGAFSTCTGLTSVTIPGGVTYLGSGVFASCTSLQSAIIQNGVTTIGSRAFASCTQLTDVTIPNSVTTIEGQAFQGCTGLQSMTIPDSVTSIGNSAFSGCTGLANVTMGSGVASIGDQAFQNCTSLQSVTIPGSVTSMGYSAFYGCTGLTSVTLESGVTSIGASAFQNCTGLQSVTIPGSVTSIGANAFQNCTGLTSATIESGATTIGSSAFQDCTGLTSVTIPGSVASIGTNAFYGCTGLTSVTIESVATSIGIYAFYGCTGLTSVTILGSVTTIGDYAFYGCTGLTSMTLPSGIATIGNYAFQGCTGLTSVTMESGVTSIGNYAFQGCTGLTGVTIPGSVTSIGNYAFQGCTGLTSATIESGVTSIGTNAFQSCISLTSVTIPSSVTTIGAYAFQGCTGFTSATMESGVISIGTYAFQSCTHLTSVTIPSSVTTIGANAFQSCTSLTSVTIPSSVTSIGSTAFTGCTLLSNVIANPTTPPTAGSNMFSSCGALTAIRVPSASVATYKTTSGWITYSAKIISQ